jgi:hypothetical protein
LRQLKQLEILKLVVQREEQLRLSDEYQQQFKEIEGRLDIDWIDIVEQDIQVRVIKEFMGEFLPDCILKEALFTLRSASTIYPEEPIFQNVHYVKFNRARLGSFRKGDSLKDVSPLWITPQHSTTLFDKLSTNSKPTILFASSLT